MICVGLHSDIGSVPPAAHNRRSNWQIAFAAIPEYNDTHFFFMGSAAQT
jgi:hypothetical protein